jgi:hypothetical protein
VSQSGALNRVAEGRVRCWSPKGACAVCARKALNQREGGTASFPLIQRFSDVRRGVSINTSSNLQDDVDVDLSHAFGHYQVCLIMIHSCDVGTKTLYF